MRQVLVVVVFFLVSVAASLPAFAVKVSSLYQYETPVDSQADDARAQAVREGFVQILIRISGDPQIIQNEVIKPVLRRADYYVQEYSYSAPTSSPYYLLQIRYDREDIARLLKKANIPYWGENRPLILVWLLFTNSKHFAEIIGNENQGSILESMKIDAKKNGLPLIFPMIDGTDVDQVNADNIKSMDLPTLKAASKRYAADALLIGVIDQTDIGYQSRWQLVLSDTKWEWKLTERMVNDVLAASLNEASKSLAKYYVEKAANAPQWIKLEVTHIMSREDLQQLMKFIKQVTAVQQVQLSRVMGDMVELSVLVRGSVTSFQQNAAINQRLKYKSQDEADNRLIYQWTQ